MGRAPAGGGTIVTYIREMTKHFSNVILSLIYYTMILRQLVLFERRQFWLPTRALDLMRKCAETEEEPQWF